MTLYCFCVLSMICEIQLCVVYSLRGTKMIKRYCKIQGSNKIYLIEKYTNNDTKVILSAENIKVKTSIANIILLPQDYVPQKINIKANITVSDETVPNEIMLRHKFKDEAICELDKYLDRALIAKIGRVRIIHGRHGGILREAVHEYLKTHPYVKEYYIAGYGEGGIGVTIAVLGKNTNL